MGKAIKVEIVGTNELFNSLKGKEFLLKAIMTTSSGVHIIQLEDYENEIYFNPNSKFNFIEKGLWIEGVAQIENSVAILSIIINYNETDAIL